MKLKNKILRFAITLFLLLLTASQVVVAQERTEELADFKEVKVFSGVEVEVIPSEENKIEISGDSKDKVRFKITENRLEIRLPLEYIWSKDNTVVKVYAENVEIIDANESAIVNIETVLKGDFLSFRAQEGAAIYAKVMANSVFSKGVTGGLVQLRGEAKSLEIDLNTGGKYFGENLQTEESTVYSGSGGEAEVFASDYCKATAKFGGKILIFGNPNKLDQKTSFGGRISKKN